MSTAYIHIPKTAGISVSWEMRKAGRRSPYAFYLADKSEAENFLSKMTSWWPGKADLTHYDVLAGHGYLSTFEKAGADNFITVVREPRARLLSSYFFLHSSSPMMLKFFPAPIFDRALFIDGPQLSLLEYIGVADIDANPISTMIGKERLASFEAVGFTETLDEFLAWVSDRFGGDIRTDRRMNVTRMRKAVDLGGSRDEIRSALTEATAQDMEIYRWATANRREGFSAPPDPDETLERTLARFGIV